MKMRLSVFSMSLFLAQYLVEGEATVKNATAYCFWDTTAETVTMQYRLKLNSEPAGDLRPVDIDDYKNKIPYDINVVTGCAKTYTASAGLYEINSVVDLGTTGAKDDNMCGRVKTIKANNKFVYEWLFLQQRQTNNHTILLENTDRLYTVKCQEDELVPNRAVSAAITVSHPNLDAIITPSTLNVTLHLLCKYTDGTETKISAGMTVPASARCRLSVEFVKEHPFDENLHPFCVVPYYATVGSTSGTPENDLLVDKYGCAVRSSTLPDALGGRNPPPSYPTSGFVGSDNPSGSTPSKYILYMGYFNLWKYDSSQNVYFTVIYNAEYKPSRSMCDNFCSYNGKTEPSRKRRQASEEPQSVSTYVVLTEEKHMDKTSDEPVSMTTMTIAIVGSVVGTLIVCLIVVLVCMLVANRRRTQEKKRHYKEPVVMPHIVPISKI